MEPAITIMHHAGEVHGIQYRVDVITIHDEEFALSDTSAESIAGYFGQKNHGDSCAHYVEDANSEQHCVPDNQIAYHAPPNMNTVGIERDGYASWSAAQWGQPAAQRTTCRVAARTAELCVRHKIPVVWLSAADNKAMKRGITSHANRSAAFHQSTHTDPGPAFPVDAFMRLVGLAYTVFSSADKVKQFQKARGLSVDGIVGSNTMNKMVEYLFDGPVAPAPSPKPRPAPPVPVSPSLRVDGIMGRATVTALQHRLLAAGFNVGSTGADGSLGPNTIKALQRYLRVPADGVIGPRTVSVLQRHVGATVDGKMGPDTIRHLQSALNNRRF